MKISLGFSVMLVLLVGCGSSTSSTPPVPGSSLAGAAADATTPGGTAAPAAAAKPVPEPLPELLATVDDDRIESWELEGAVKGLEARAGSPVPPEKRDEVLRGLLDQLVAYHVLVREARERKVASTDAEVEARMSQVKGGFASEQAFQEALTARGMTLVQMQRQTRMSIDIDKLIQAEVIAKITIPDSEVAAYYQQNLVRFAQTESVHASHVLVATPQGMLVAEKDAAKTKAQDILKRLKGGADFAGLAREQSQDPGSAPGGGDLGFFPKGQTDPAFEAAAFALKPGGLSEVVETPFGFHVIKVHAHRAARTAPLDEVSVQIKEFLAGQQRDTRIQAFVEQAKGQRKVEILI